MAATGPRLPFAWQAQYTCRASAQTFCVAGAVKLSGGAAARWPPLARGCLLPGRRSTQSFLAELRRGGRRWPAAAFCLAGASWRSCGAVAAAGPRLPFAWQAQYTELPGGAVARWPPLARGCLLPGRRSTQSLRTDLLRGMRRTQSFLAELWRGGRRWPAAAFCLARTVHRASALQPPHRPFAWHAQYTKLSGGAVARWPPLARGCLLPGSQPYTGTLAWQAQYRELHCSSQILTAPLLTGPLLITTHHNLSHPNSSQFHFSHLTSHSSLITSQLLITPYHNLSHHSSTSHTPSHTSLITSELITAPLLTPDITSPLLTPHFSHLPEVHIKILHT